MQASFSSVASQQQALPRAGHRRPFAAAAAPPRSSRTPQQQRLSGRAPAVHASAALGLHAASLAAPVRRGSSCRRAMRLIVRANWGAPVEFSPAKVVSNAKVAEQLHKVVVDVGDLAAGYTKPGQFVQIKVGEEGKPGFFAIASAPDPNNQGLLEFLIKAQGGAAEAIAALGTGAEVAASAVMGKGFPMEKIPAEGNPTVLLFATGSGISPIKALIESGELQADKRSDVRLYYGTRDAAHTAYADRIPAWEKAGVKVIQVFSNGDGAKYVQEVFKADMGLAGADKGGVGAVLCGHKEMCNAVKESLAAEGVDGDKMLLNF